LRLQLEAAGRDPSAIDALRTSVPAHAGSAPQLVVPKGLRVLRQDACHFGAATEQRADPVMLNRFTRLIAGQLFRLQGVPPPELEVTILFADVEVARCSLVTTDHYDCGVAPSDILKAKR
jgi:hypothetical protein